MTRTFFNYCRRRFSRLLLLAVLLLAFGCIRQAASAKYAAYLYDFTSAVADDFYFSSDYLRETEKKQEYFVNTWDGKTYEVTLEIRNYENSLRFNHEGTDFYYYVDAALYKSADMEEKDDQFTITITYDSEVNQAYFMDDGSTGERENGTWVECRRMNGTASFDKYSGAQKVTISLDSEDAGKETIARYLKVTAHTVPSGVPLYEEKNNSGTPIEYNDGVFYETREAVFALSRKGGEAGISTQISNSDDYTVTYKLLCAGVSGGSSTKVRVYYNPDKVSPASELGTVLTDTTGYKGFHSYVMVSVNDSGTTSLPFYKSNINTVVTEDDFTYNTVNSIDLDDTQYRIDILEAEGGSLSSAASEATLNQQILITVTPESGLGLAAATVTATRNNIQVPIKDTLNGFSFFMPDSDVKISAIFQYLVNSAESAGGSITATKKLANAGDVVVVNVVPSAGYVSGIPVVTTFDGEAVTVEDVDGNYSFTMPPAGVIIKGVFTQDNDTDSEIGNEDDGEDTEGSQQD